jgi:SAM-dependent methyltransferase
MEQPLPGGSKVGLVDEHTMRVLKMHNKARAARQSIQNLKGEIEFREKLSRQHVSGEIVLHDYYKKEDHDKILLERVKATYVRMNELRNRGIRFSPFLELGAERGQRSLVLTNDFDATGVAADISYHQLRTTEYFSRLFKKEKLPVRICCDANHLPFKNNSFPFIFCYEFLHHFPSLKPIVTEIYRVLSDGYFFFDEEPFKRVLKATLYKQKDKVYSDSALKKNGYIELLESFISEPACDEIEHGIIENNNISLAQWIDALSIFEEHDVDLLSIYNVSSKLHDRIRLRNIPNFLLGGTIAGLCRKKTILDQNIRPDLDSLLGCPDCTIPSERDVLDRPSLIKLPDGFKCSKCGFHYPCRDGIIFLLPQEELQQLYPDFYEFA